MTALDALRLAAEDARADYKRAAEFRYPRLERGEPVEDLTELLDAADEAESLYLAALGVPGEYTGMATSCPDYTRSK